MFSPRLAGFVLDAFAGSIDVAAVDEDLDRLTEREREVMRLIARGYAYKEVAKELFISIKTVETHMSTRAPQAPALHPPRAHAAGPRTAACSEARARPSGWASIDNAALNRWGRDTSHSPLGKRGHRGRRTDRHHRPHQDESMTAGSSGPSPARQLFFYTLGDVLGSGIYVLIGLVAAAVGGAFWIAFALGVTVAAITGTAYAELVTKYPQAAGAALYVNKAFGNKALTFLVTVSFLSASFAAAGLAGDRLRVLLRRALGRPPALLVSLRLRRRCCRRQLHRHHRVRRRSTCSWPSSRSSAW